MKTSTSKLLFIPTALVLLIYPFILIANLMSFVAESTGDESSFLLFVAKGFLITSTLYPLTFLYAIVKFNKADDIVTKRKMAKLPYYHLGIAFLFLLVWALGGS